MENNDKSLIRNKSNFVLSKDRAARLGVFVQNAMYIPLKPAKLERKLNSPEQKSVSTLANKENIIIMQADKSIKKAQ